MEKKLLHDCPVCGKNLRVRVLQCPGCQTRIEGNFKPNASPIFYLSGKELEFVELFIKVRGNIKEVEKALGISYPTVRGMLDSIPRTMGYQVKRTPDAKKRMEIIERLEKGQIDAAQAAELLKNDTAEAVTEESKEGEEIDAQ
ncbi:hypothetical protein ES705_05988 [subsurface metagenome]